ncbi:MAG TPA: L,D-transpeptidase family protein [Baekduia sp.]
MALRTAPSSSPASPSASPRRSRIPRRRWPLLLLVPLALVIAAGAAVLEWSGATLAGDSTALAHVHVQALGGTLQSAHAVAPGGKVVPVTVVDGRVTPNIRVTPGENISVDVVIKRPGALSWLLGKTRHETLTVRTPTVKVTSPWLNVAHGAPVSVGFDAPVAGVAFGTDKPGARQTVAHPLRTISLGDRAAAGSVRIAVAARGWERLEPATKVTWFPQSQDTAMISSPANGGKISPVGALRFTFATTVKDALGGKRPTLSPKTDGKFTEPDSHTLLFTPSGSGFGIGGGTVHLQMPKSVGLASTADGTVKSTQQLTWTVPPASTMRLQQLLAQAGYLPLDWKASGEDVKNTRAAQASAAVDAPAGDFTWRYANTPPELKKQWIAGQANAILRGAVMMFQDNHHLTVDGFAGPAVWTALLADTVAGKKRTDGYSYVYVHRDTPQLLTLWHNGHVVMTSPGNTGVPAAPTKLGTFPVFEHIASTTMSGTNPDGSHYNDPGVKWVSYFNGGDALHAFNRASFGTPQSLGCVELPEASAKRVWPYTPIGTLVTIEH